MKVKKNGLLANGLIWFAAATSLAEIEAGIHCKGNLIAVLLGHLLGFVLLFATGVIGGRRQQTAMQTTAQAFGEIGSRVFAGLNMLQLVGWSAVMISLGGMAATPLLPHVGFPFLCAIIGALAIVGLLVDFRHATALSFFTIALLAGLAVFLTGRLAFMPPTRAPTEATSFASAFELSVAMPLSWLPLISDYTRDADRPVAVSLVSALVYSVVSVWMYGLGMLIAAGNTENSVTQAIVHAGLGVAGLVIVLLSTSLSAFFDLYSSGESGKVLLRRFPPKVVGFVAGAIGTGLAVCGIQERYANFLCLIASVFAPMAAVLLVSHYFVRRRHIWINATAWLVGTVLYHSSDASPLGPTLTALLAASALAALGKLVKPSSPESPVL